LAEADDVLCILGQVVWREDAMDMQTGNTAGKDAGRDKQAGRDCVRGSALTWKS
jgi:hypothetical protein